MPYKDKKKYLQYQNQYREKNKNKLREQHKKYHIKNSKKIQRHA